MSANVKDFIKRHCLMTQVLSVTEDCLDAGRHWIYCGTIVDF